MALSSYCKNCGAPHASLEEMYNVHCNNCETSRTEAIQAAAAKANEAGKPMSESDLLYVGRQALMQRAQHPRQTFINPRDFNRADMERR